MNEDNYMGSMAHNALMDVNGGASALTPEPAPDPIAPISSQTASNLSPDDGSGAIMDGLKAPDQNALTTAINAAKSEAMKRMLRGMAETPDSSQDLQSAQNVAVGHLARKIASASANEKGLQSTLQKPLQKPLTPLPQAPQQPEVTIGRSIFGGQVPTFTRKDGVVAEFGDDFDMNDRVASARAVSEANGMIDMMNEMYENA